MATAETSNTRGAEEQTHTIEEHDHHHEHESWLEMGIIGVTGIMIFLYWTGILKEVAGVDLALVAALIGGFPIIKEALVAVVTRGDTKLLLLWWPPLPSVNTWPLPK